MSSKPPLQLHQQAGDYAAGNVRPVVQVHGESISATLRTQVCQQREEVDRVAVEGQMDGVGVVGLDAKVPGGSSIAG